MTDKIKWACPDCGTSSDGVHGIGTCSGNSLRTCGGFCCECESDTNFAPDHGETLSTRCTNARCYHCGWQDEFPPFPKALKPWEKSALAAGWTPPAGRFPKAKTKAK